MLKNYFLTAIRHLQKQRVLAFINVFGLSVGIACCSLLLLFASNEFGFDKFHKNASNIYRVYDLWDNPSNGEPPVAYTEYSGPTAATLGEAMKQALPDVKEYTQLQLPWGENLVRAGEKMQRITLSFADPSFFSVFDFPLQHGEPSTALHDINDIVLTRSRAKQLFGTDEVVGRTLDIQIGTSFQPFKITAVAKDIPGNSTVRFDVLGNFLFATRNHNQFFVGSNWHPTVRQTFVLLKEGSRLPKDQKRLTAFLQYFNPNLITELKNNGWKGGKLPISLGLQPLLSIHTDTWFHGWAFTDYEKINPNIVWILLAIAGGILLIACINFTTLAIGRSAGRSKEVGVRKVIGAERRQIISQFFVEAISMSMISALLGLLLASLLLPWFNQLAGRDLHFSLTNNPKLIFSLTAVVLTAGLLAGIYPSLVLSGFKPVEVLKNKIRIGGSNLFTRSLVTFQFTLSIALIIATVIILQQAKYMINKDPGFNRENLVAIDASQADPNNIYPAFKQQLLNHPGVLGVASSAAGMGAGKDLLGFSDKGVEAAVNVIDTDYIKVMGMQLIAGENLSPSLIHDSIQPIIINETMMRAFGWQKENAVGQRIRPFQGVGLVIGVVKNFNFRPLGEPVRNQVFTTSKNKGFINFYVRINAGNPAPLLAAIQRAWNNVMPGIPMKYSFLDEDINNYYKSEQTWSRIVGWAGGISIVLACLGLLGLSSLAAVNRTKEIGIRKVLGASVPGIVTLMSKDFLKLILIAFLIASPLAWYLMNAWLQDYAVRINISWMVFLLAGASVVVIAIIAISFHAIRAALTNPSRSLRTE